MLAYILFLTIGFALLIKGADWLVSGSSALARRFHISELIIGLTVVAFGTSAPELVVNIIASAKDYDDVVLGNILGSNIFNLLLILSISGMIYPIAVESSTVWKEIPFSLAITLLLFLLVADTNVFGASTNMLAKLDGILLLCLFILFLIYIFFNIKKENTGTEVETNLLSLSKTILFIIIGLSGLIIGGKLVVNNAIEIARTLNISEKLIGLTIVSIGTSLPELATSIIAAIKKNSDLAIGNIIGSNIFNIALILGISSFISPVNFSPSFNFDIGVLIFSTLLVFIAMFTGKKKKLDRWEAFLLGILFIGYVIFSINR